MKAFVFIQYLISKFPALFFFTTLLLLTAGFVEALAILSIAPIVDLLIKTDVINTSPITQKLTALMVFINIPATLVSFLAFFFLLNLLKSVFQIIATYLLIKTKYAVFLDILMGTFEDFFNARWYFFSSSKQGELLNTFIREMTVIGDAFSSMTRFFANIMQTFILIAIPFYISWQVTSITLLSVMIFASLFFLFSKVSYQMGKKNTVTGNHVWAVVQESFALSKVILGYGNQKKSIEALRKTFNLHCDAIIKSLTFRQAIPVLYNPFGILAVSITLIYANSLNFHISEMSILIYALFRIIPIVSQVINEKNSMDSFVPSYEQVTNLRNRAKQLKQESGSRIFTDFHNKIVLKNVSFAYPDHKPILFNINVNISKGQMIAFVGESGAGKSTLIDIIMGFNKPIKGEITIDGIYLQDFDVNSYRRRIGYVPQESILFNMSIKDNLRWANEGASMEEIKRASQMSNAHDFIVKMPDGYDTVVGDRGVRLSGGQRQRIALARALIRKPELLILDEATSSLDRQSEILIQQAIEKIVHKTTIVVIAHRLSTIAKADWIYVLENGRIVEQGNYQKLIKHNKGPFSKMAELQDLASA
jgi:ATP-binding cassette subfamily B protein